MKTPLLCALGCSLLPGALLAQSPNITNTQPIRNALAVDPAAPVSLTFSQLMDPTTASSVRVHGSRTGSKAGNYSASGATVTFAPAASFKAGETVSVMVPATVRSSAGAGAVPQVFQYSTAVAGFGGGTFVAPSVNPEPGVSSGPQNLVLGDADGDGDLDLFTVSFGSSAQFIVNVGINGGLNSGNFTVSAANGVLPLVSGTRALALGDVDGDGDLDLATAVNSSAAGIWRNDAGTFVSPVTAQTITPVSGLPVDLALADVNGDGYLDMVSANANGVVSTRWNTGSGTFTRPAAGGDVTIGTSAIRVQLGDLDLDGDLDAVTMDADNVYVLQNTGLNSGTFVLAGTVALGASLRSMALGDVNGDGSLDVVVSRRQGLTGVAQVLLNTGTGSLVSWSTVAVGDKPDGVALGDVDGDGDLDLVVGNDNYNVQSVSLRLNGGVSSGTFFEPTDVAELPIGARFPWAVALGDVNGDGQLDLFTGNNNNSGSGTGGGVGTVSVRLNQTVLTRAVANPTVGNVGTLIKVRAADVSGTTSVSFNGTPASSFRIISPATLEATVPTGATTGPITITTPRGVLTSNTRFVVGGITATRSAQPASLAIFPNPAHRQVTLVLAAGLPAASGVVTLRNALGQAVRQQATSVAPGGTQVVLDVSGLAAGVYTMHLQAGALNEVHRLVVE